MTTHVSSGDYQQAKMCAHKAMLLAIILSLFATAMVFILGEVLVTWLTPDPTLQKMMFELLPMVGFGQLIMAFCAVCWSILGSQGRYHVATFSRLATTWLFIVPFSAIFVYGGKFNLLGLISSLVLGGALRGVSNAYLIFRSDWKELCLEQSTVNTERLKRKADDNRPTNKEIPSASDASINAKLPKDSHDSTLKRIEQSPEAVKQPMDAVKQQVAKPKLGKKLPLESPGVPIDEETGFSQDADDTSSRPGMVIDTSTISAGISSCTSVGGVEDKWEASGSESDDDESDSEGEPNNDMLLSYFPIFNTNGQATTQEKSASGWGFF